MRGRHVRRVQRRRYAQRRIAILVIAGIFLIFLLSRLIFHTLALLFPVELVDESVKEIAGIPLHTDFLPEDYAGRTGEQRRIKWLVIHETGNTAAGTDAEMHNRYLHSPEQKEIPLSWHYTVDDHQIYHHLPDDEKGYHASDSSVKGGGNECGIGIEICINEDGDFDKAVDHAAKLAAYLMQRYHLDLNDVKQHGDFTNKDCPAHLRQGDQYAQFLEKIKAYEKEM